MLKFDFQGLAAGLCVFGLSFTIARAQVLPTITVPPQNATVSTNVNATLVVTATGATSYQWRFNGSDLPGATASSLVVTNAQLTNSGYYVVVAKNDLGWVPSLPAYLSVVDVTGMVRLSNRFITNEQAFYQFGIYGPYDNGNVPITNGTAFAMAGPVLDQMQPLSGTLAVSGGFYGLASPIVPTVAAGQTAYYRVGISYPLAGSPGNTFTQVSTVVTVTAGGGAFPILAITNLHFPQWLEWPDYDPEIWTATTNQLRIPGESFTITNVITGFSDFGNPIFQWRKDGKDIGVASSAPLNGYYLNTNVTLTFSNLQPSDAGVYDIKYLGNNWIIGPKTILSVQVTNGEGRIQSPRAVGSNFVFDLTCAARRTYVIQRSTNLVNWTDLQTVTNTSVNQTGLLSVTNSSSGAAAYFYRSRLVP